MPATLNSVITHEDPLAHIQAISSALTKTTCFVFSKKLNELSKSGLSEDRKRELAEMASEDWERSKVNLNDIEFDTK